MVGASKYVRAILLASAASLIFGGLFMVWRQQTLPLEGIKNLERLDKMEASGLPLFSGKDLNGVEFKLKDVKDQIVIVNFWATWCGPCVEEVPSLISLVEAMQGKVRWVAVSADNSKDDINAFLKAFPKMKGPNTTIIYDEDRSISRAYSVDRFPESFIGNKQLKLVKKITGSIQWHTPESVKYLEEVYSK